MPRQRFAAIAAASLIALLITGHANDVAAQDQVQSSIETCQANGDRQEADAAIAACTAALAAPDLSIDQRAMALTERGIAYSAKDDNDLAYADFDAALELRPKDAQAYDNRGNASSARGDQQAALADFDRAIALDPDHGPHYFSRGLMLEEQA